MLAEQSSAQSNSGVLTYPRKRYETLEMLTVHALLGMMIPRCRWFLVFAKNLNESVDLLF